MWLLAGFSMLKRPSAELVTPEVVPIQNTLAPGMGSPCLSFTVPRTCAYVKLAVIMNSIR